MTTPKPVGILCPMCGGSLRVVKVRRRASGAIVRRRECRECQFRVTTGERIIGVGPYMDPSFK